MLDLICGGTYSVREAELFDRIEASAKNGEDVLCIVPDQFSFEFDKKLYERLGAKLFNRISTAGFNKLSEMIAKKLGSAGESCTDHVRTVLMYLSVRKLAASGSVRFYKRDIDKPHFISDCLSIVSDLRESGITPEQMRAAAEKHGGALAGKLFDLSFIYEAYMAELEGRGMTDSVSALTKACKKAEESGFFSGKKIFVDSFSGFTYDEKNMLGVCLSQCKNITVTLVLDEDCVRSCHAHPFEDTARTLGILSALAKDHGVDVRITNCKDRDDCDPSLLYLSKNLYNYNKKAYENTCDSVRVIGCSDVFEESEYICSEIKRLVREEGFRYSDIAVMARDLPAFSSAAESAFERYEIPFFTDRGESAETSSIVRYMITLFKCLLTREYSTDNIMKLIRSPLYPMNDIDVSSLEQYCFIWGVDKELWKEPFIPSGRLTDKQLAHINSLREKVITPFENFKKAIGDEPTASRISEALYDFFREIGFSQQTYSVVRRASAADTEGGLEAARDLKQLWNSVLSAIKTVYEYVGDTKMSLRKYSELFRVMISNVTVSKPPQRLDCVMLCEAGHSRTGELRAVFAAEVNDGIFPANVSSDGLISEFEKALLLSEDDMPIGQSAKSRYSAEKLICYNALTLPKEKLYALYSRSDLLGESKRPSLLIEELLSMFKSEISVNASALAPEFFVSGYKSAYYKYLERIADQGTVTATLRALLSFSDEYSLRLASHENIHEDGNYSLPSDTSDKLFFHDGKMAVSPTQLDDYFKCPFSYFCKYGLYLRAPQKKAVKSNDKGSLIHRLLERLLKVGSEDREFGAALVGMNDEELTAFVKREVKAYIDDELGGDYAKDAEFEYTIRELERSALETAQFVRAELSGTKFVPKFLEYRLDPEKEELEIDAGDGRKIVLKGTVDRADVYEDDNGELYLRIIDYKTGKRTTFSYSKLYNGLNLQMFVYLSGLLSSGGLPGYEKRHFRQAAVMYYIFGKSFEMVKQSGSDENDRESVRRKVLNSFKPEGRIVNSETIMSAFNESDGYSYSPHKLVKNTGEVKCAVTDEQFSALCTFARNKTSQFGKDLRAGHIDAKPIDDTCSFCDYAGICGLVNRDDATDTSDKKYEELMCEEIDKLVKEGRSDEQ